MRTGFTAALATAALFVALSTPLAVRAACECGYLDPATQALWTDATIVYFNETGMEQIVQPAVSPKSIYGNTPAGDSGTGQEAFTQLGDFINPYENDFGATYRSAISYNNTFADAQTAELGIAMQISPADWRHHIVNSSQIMTRRRDIQYGSFRAMVQHANTTGYGGAFEFAVAYNESEIIDTGIYLGDLPENSTLRWAFSAAGADADPVKQNLTYLKNRGDPRTNNLTYLNTVGPVEHRMDWLGSKQVQFRNSGQNNSLSFLEYVKGKNATNLPTSPAPVSFRTWANGEPSVSQGPPLFNPLITRIKYVRFFFNSTLVARNAEFVQQCQSLAAPVCSTEDWTLRNSTQFSTEALLRVLPVKAHFKVPIWGIVPTTFFTALFLAIVVHGMVVNAGKAKQRKADAAEGTLMDDGASIKTGTTRARTPRLRPFGLQQGNEMNKRFTANVSDVNEEAGEIPELYHDWVDSDSEYDSEDYDDAEVLEGELDDTRRMSRIRRLSSMFTRRRSTIGEKKGKNRNSVRMSVFGAKGDQDVSELPEHSSTANLVPPVPPMPSHHRFEAYRFGGPSMTEDTVSEAENANRLSAYEDDAKRPSQQNGGQQNGGRWQQRNVHPTIVNWQSRTDDSDVGQLARPISMAPSHRLSIVPVQHSLIYMVFQRARGMIFVGNANGPKTSTGERRIDYLDGMRGFACWGVSVAHFTLMFYHGISDANELTMHYPKMEIWLRRIIAPIYINAGLLLGIFFFLPGRTMCQRYLLKGGLATMADSTIRRLPRLILPVLGACLINYMLIDVGGYRWIRSLASVTWSTWAYYQNYDNVMTFVNGFIGLWWAAPPDSPALLTTYATGVLWTIPLIVQGLWTCMLCALVAHEIKRPWKRFTFYAICIFISWYTLTWDMFFMGGLVIADLDANIKYREKAEKGIPVPFLHGVRIKGSLFAWLFFGACLTQQYFLFNPGAPGGDLNMIEYGYHPNMATSQQIHDNPAAMVYHYQDPRVFSWLLVVSIFILADLSRWFQTIWRLKLWAWLGTQSMSIFLLHGAVFWTWGAWLMIFMLTRGVAYWAAALTVFITSYMFLFTAAVCFTNTFEYWAALLSKACMRAATGGYGRKI